MRKSIITGIIFLIFSQAYCQVNKYDIVVSYGFYNAPNYDRIKKKDFFAADFDYHLSDKITISSGFMRGRFLYFENVRTLVFPDYEDGPDVTNGRGYESHTHLSILYSVVNNRKFILQVGTGVGLFTRTLKYPYRAPSSAGGELFLGEHSFDKFEIPFRMDIYYTFNNRLGVGLKTGAFVQSNGPMVGAHIGPQLRVRL